MTDFEIRASSAGDHVTVVEFERLPGNYFTAELIHALADMLESLAHDGTTRAVVLASRGKNFCPGADFSSASSGQGVELDVESLYQAGARLFDQPLPVIAQVQGAAIGGGLGLALSADFRVVSTTTKLAANFSTIGLHHGFGLTVTLPESVGLQKARDMLLTGRIVHGEEAYALGLADRLSEPQDLASTALALSHSVAIGGPLATRAMRATMRAGLADRVRAATEHERVQQDLLFPTADFVEGVSAVRERRPPEFQGR